LPPVVTAAEILAAATGAVARAVAADIPGAVLGVATAAGDRAVATFGLAQREPDPVPVHRGTWFDLASLTKVLFTTPTILRLAAQGRVALDDRLVVAIPDLRQYDANAAERHLTFRQCLSHQTHLPAVEPLYTYGLDPATLRAFILQREWRSGPPVYSDINFMLLGIAVERLAGCSLGNLPLPPGLAWRPEPAETAATERCTWRGRIMRGEVHDENAFALGGAAGHAGLFGTIDGVLMPRSISDCVDRSPRCVRVSRQHGARPASGTRDGRAATPAPRTPSVTPVSPGPASGSTSAADCPGRC
jgi:CubicO group peptidase (beta-lactamase class C family)